MKLSTYNLDQGINIFSFVGGTRKRGEKATDIDRISEDDVRGGIGRLAVQTSNKEYDVCILPMTVWYGRDQQNFFTPNIHIAHPIEGPFINKREVIAQVREAMSKCLDISIDRSEQREATPRSFRQRGLSTVDRLAKSISCRVS